ncbi:unnamed protein product [Dicrocoelium dendriticum]|nr:unnamed protein product [Dicrocoelium dendriticum]
MANQSPCGISCKVVGHRANAIPCSLCSIKFHISCFGLSVDQFRETQGIRNEFLKIICKQRQSKFGRNGTDKPNKRISRAKCSKTSSSICKHHSQGRRQRLVQHRIIP